MHDELTRKIQHRIDVMDGISDEISELIDGVRIETYYVGTTDKNTDEIIEVIDKGMETLRKRAKTLIEEANHVGKETKQYISPNADLLKQEIEAFDKPRKPIC